MNVALNKPFYKGISLFIKSLILFFSFYYIWTNLEKASFLLTALHLSSFDNLFFALLVFLLMFANWGLEALKWKLLVAPLESISLITSLKGIVSGITIGIFTPNRVGEFAGRVFFLQKADKVHASIISIVGSFFQLTVTVIIGVMAFVILQKKYYNFFQTNSMISVDSFLIMLGLLVLFIAGLFFIILKRQTIFARFKKYIETLKLYSNRELLTIFYISFFRYVVFSVQYYLTLRLFGINGGIVILFSLIALTFVITSAIPTFALTEIAVRVGAAIYFFGTISTDHSSILAASLFLWMINLAIPALIGSAFVWKVKFFKI